LITNDFSKPKNKLIGSRILPEPGQTIKILKVLPHFKDSQLLYWWSGSGDSKKGFEKSNAAFHKCCDDKGPLLVLVKLNNNNSVFGVR
jgi:hypothetical protein